MHLPTAVFSKYTGEQHVTVQKSPLNHPQATLFNLMLTACDVVICYLLMDNTSPNCMKEKPNKGKTKLMTCITLFHAFPEGRQSKDNCLYLPFFNSIILPARTLQHTLVSSDTGRSTALSVFSKNISLYIRLLYSLSPHYSNKYDFPRATSHSF